MSGCGAASIARRRLGPIAACLAAVVAASGCGGSPRPANVVVIASGTDLESANPLTTIHPLSRQVQRYVLLVTLARYDSLLRPAPYFARRWDWSADRATLVLHLAQGLRWHDGTPTTAHDVAFTLDAARDPATGYARASELQTLTAVEARDDSTVVLSFAAPPPEFPLVLCEMAILPAHLLASVPHAELRHAAFDLDPVGNGPFVFAGRTPGQQWRFRRNAAFPAELGGPPQVAGVVIAVVDEATTKFAGLASGDLDLAGISPVMASLVRRDRSLRVLDYPVLFTTGLVLNTHRPPFDDVRVRRAVSLSLDRARIVAAALAGYGVPAAGPVPPESPMALSGAPVRDPQLADSLLDAAGWRRDANGRRVRDGRPFRVELLTVGSGDNAVEQLVQADLAERGIRVEIRQSELGAFLTAARAATKRYDMLITGIPGDVALSYVSALFDSRQAGGALDYAGFHTPALDALLARARAATGDSARRAAWWDVQRELARDVPIVWLYHSRGVQGVSRRLQNVEMDLRGELVTLARWRVAPGGA